MSRGALWLGLLALAIGMAEARPSFPYCKCLDYSANSAPYTVSLVSATSVSSDMGDGFEMSEPIYKAVFNVAPRQADVPATLCYNKLTMEGVHKIAFDTSMECDKKVKVLINGIPSTDSKVEESSTNGLGYIRTMFKPVLLGNVSAEITIIGMGSCANPNTLFHTDATPFIFKYSLFNAPRTNMPPCCATSQSSAPSPPPPPPSPSPPPPPPPSPSPPPPSPNPPSPNPPSPSPPSPSPSPNPPSPNPPSPEPSPSPSPAPEESSDVEESSEESASPSPSPEPSPSPSPETSPIFNPQILVPPSPPHHAPPAPPGPFPWCRCSVATFDTPWYIQTVGMSSTDTTNVYTMNIAENGCLESSPCCNMDLWKIEFHVGDECTKSVAGANLTINYGVDGAQSFKKSFLFHHYGEGRTVFKVTTLGLNTDTAYGSQISFALKKDSACPDIDTFLAQTKYALFNKKQTCCPTWNLYGKNKP